MTIQEYISSGLLESYVLGLTSEEETREVESLAEQHPSIREEIEAIQGALEKYALQFAQPPAEKLKSKVMAALDDLDATPQVSQPFIAVERTADDTDTADPTPIALPPQTKQRMWLAAASIVLGISFLGNLFLYQKWQKAENTLAYTQAQQQHLALQTQTMQNQMQTVMKLSSVVTNPEYKIINMMAADTQSDAMAVLYWHPSTGNLYVSCQKLANLPQGKAYRLWLITGNGPTWAGDVPVQPHQKGLITMKSLSMPAAAFAITIEDAQESTAAPAGTMYVKGSV